MNSRKTLVLYGAMILAAVVLAMAGVVLLQARDGEDLEVRGEQASFSDGRGGAEKETSAALRKRVKDLESQLAKSRARLAESRDRVRGLERQLARSDMNRPVTPDPIEKPKAGKVTAGKKGKDAMAWAKKKPKLGLPEGMTREEQGARVREIVDAHDWQKSASALAAWGRADRRGRGISLSEKEALGPFFEMLGRLGELGVGFYDPRVARMFVPAWTSGLGADLDARQSEQLTAFIDETARQEEIAPESEPEFPLRYAHEKARDLQRTLELERQMESLLRPEQFQSYLAEVGDDPFTSGFGFKTSRMTCAGKTVNAVGEEVARLWLIVYKLEARLQPQVVAAAQRFVTGAMALPVPSAGLDASARRRAILERAVRGLQLQGNAEQTLLTTLPLSDDERRAALGRHCPVLDLEIRK
jgi:hypothetical protein